MCVLSIKVPIRKKSGNLFNDPRNNPQILFCIQCLVFEIRRIIINVNESDFITFIFF